VALVCCAYNCVKNIKLALEFAVWVNQVLQNPD
jgi:hypothetical protein